MKILKITLVAIISSFLMILSSNALEKRIGVAAGFTNVSADGTETIKDSSKKVILRLLIKQSFHLFLLNLQWIMVSV